MWSAIWSSVTTTALIGIALYLSRTWIVTRLAQSIQHEYNEKLERLRDDLKTESSRVDALRGGALTGVTTRQAALGSRRLKAVDEFWTAFLSLGIAKSAVLWMSTIRFEPLLTETAKNAQLRDALKPLLPDSDKLMGMGSGGANQRPFISDLAWAYFQAYAAIGGIAIAQLKMLQLGLDAPKAIDAKSVLRLVKAALPHRSEYVDKHGLPGCYGLMDEIESALLTELRAFVANPNAGRAHLEQAAAILKAADEVKKSAEPTPDLDRFSV